MSLFGTTAPQFKNSTQTTTVLLDYSLIEPDWTEPKEIEQESVITGERDYVTIGTGDHSQIKIIIHLWKYGTQAQQKTKFKEIYAYNHSDVVFWPNRDGSALKDSTGAVVLFHIVKIDLYNQVKPDWYDTMVIYLRSKKPVDIDYNL